MPPASPTSAHPEDDPPANESAGPKAHALQKALRPLVRWSKWRQAALRQEKRDAQRELRAAATNASVRGRAKSVDR